MDATQGPFPLLHLGKMPQTPLVDATLGSESHPSVSPPPAPSSPLTLHVPTPHMPHSDYHVAQCRFQRSIFKTFATASGLHRPAPVVLRLPHGVSSQPCSHGNGCVDLSTRPNSLHGPNGTALLSGVMLR